MMKAPILLRSLDSVTWGTLLLLAVGAALRIAMEFPLHRYPGDADSILTGLTAFRLLHGHPPVFFASGVRLGAAGSYVAAALFLLFGPSRATLAAGPLLVDLLQLLIWTLFLRALLGPRVALLALPFAALPSPAFSFWTYMPDGYPETLLFCTTTLWLAARLAGGDERKLTAFAFGVSIGLGWWSSPATLACSGPAMVWLAWRRRSWFKRGAMALAALGICLGALPWIAFNVRYPLASLHGSYATQPARIGALLGNARYVFSDQLPEMVAPLRETAARNAAASLLRWPTVLISAGAGLYSLVVAPLLRWRRTRRPRLAATSQEPDRAGRGAAGERADEPSDERGRAERFAWPLLVLVPLATLALNMVSEAGSMRGPVSTVRYVLPIYLMVPAVMALSWGAIGSSPGSRSRAIAGLLAGIVIAFNIADSLLPWTPERRQWARELDAYQLILQTLRQERVTAVLGPYWAVYPLNFLSQEAIVGVPVKAKDDFCHAATRLPTTPVRWALISFSASELVRVAQRLQLAREVRSIGRSSLLVLRGDASCGETPEQVLRRLRSAW
jgi:hypothetical protein